MKTINFIGNRTKFGWLSIIMVALSIVVIATKGIEKSVDFAGGTAMTVKFQDVYETQNLREKVSQVDNKAAIYKNEVTSGSEFTIKIKEPDVEEGKEAEASLIRLISLERAFASLDNEDQSMLALLTQIDVDSLTTALIKQNPYELVDTESVIQDTYRAMANSIKANVAGSTTIQALAEKVNADKALVVEQTIQFCFPAVNRTTSELLDTYLQKFDPLGRGMGVSYEDIAAQVEAARNAQNDFITDLNGLIESITVKEGENKANLTAFMSSHLRTGEFVITSNETFSPTVAGELLASAFEAIIFALIGILIYISMRFTMAYAVASVAALAHDVIIALGAFSLVGAELSSPVVAAFLTIVGYSLNDTIVVFDRIREKVKGRDLKNFAEMMNQSVNETLSRTLITSGTTLMVITVIYFGANATLRDFAFPLLVGIVVGTYSSIFVASPLVLFWHNRIKPIST